MLPVLFSVVLQPSWAPLAAAVLALLSGAWQARGARVAGDPWKKALQTGALWAGGRVGSRVLFIIVCLDDYAHDPGSIFAFWKGGLVFYGVFIGAVLVSIW